MKRKVIIALFEGGLLVKPERIKYQLTALVILTWVSLSFAQSPDTVKLNQFFDRLAEKNQAMGSLYITKDGKVEYTRSIGFSQITSAEKKPLTNNTKYRIGSVTKMFTTAMIFQLINEGKLKLSDTLDRFFPQIPNAEKITISQLLGHRSGIPDLTDGSGKMNPKTQSEILAIIAKGTPDFEPDAKYTYSNSGFVVLGFIIENITGTPYQDNLNKRICAKIGLRDTYLGTEYTDINKNESFSYRYVGDWKQEPETHLSIAGGAGAVISTPADLAKFIQALFDGKIVSQESLSHMIQNNLGMETFSYNSKTFYGHTGGIDNFGSWLVYSPEEKLVVSYSSNAKVYPVTQIIDGVFNIYYDKPFTIPAFESIVISSEVLEGYVGVYSSPEAPVKFTITQEGSGLVVQMPNKSLHPLEPLAQDKFRIGSAPIEFLFNVDKNEMIIFRNGNEKVFIKEK